MRVPILWSQDVPSTCKSSTNHGFWGVLDIFPTFFITFVWCFHHVLKKYPHVWNGWLNNQRLVVVSLVSQFFLSAIKKLVPFSYLIRFIHVTILDPRKKLMSFIFPVLNLHHLGNWWQVPPSRHWLQRHKKPCRLDDTFRLAPGGSSSWGHVIMWGNEGEPPWKLSDFMWVDSFFAEMATTYGDIWRFITEKISYRFGYVMNFIWLGVWTWSRNSPSLCLKMDFSLGIVTITRQGRTRIMGKGGKGKGKITKAGFRRETSELLMLLLVCIYIIYIYSVTWYSNMFR